LNFVVIIKFCEIDMLYLIFEVLSIFKCVITLNPIVEIILISIVYVICILEIFNKKFQRKKFVKDNRKYFSI
jgi:hypothetical protein